MRRSHIEAEKTLRNWRAKKKLKMSTDVAPHVIGTLETYQMTSAGVADTHYDVNKLKYNFSELYFEVNIVSNIA